jgi:hypothetical protein
MQRKKSGKYWYRLTLSTRNTTGAKNENHMHKLNFFSASHIEKTDESK